MIQFSKTLNLIQIRYDLDYHTSFVNKRFGKPFSFFVVSGALSFYELFFLFSYKRKQMFSRHWYLHVPGRSVIIVKENILSTTDTTINAASDGLTIGIIDILSAAKDTVDGIAY